MNSRCDDQYMLDALALARRGWGLTNPNPMVGALIVRDGEVLGSGYHHGPGQPHAEIEALRSCAERGVSVSGAEMYVNLEPCCTFGRTPPCTDALISSGLKRVVIGCLDPNPRHAGKGVEILRQAGIVVDHPVQEAACRRLNEAFFHWIVHRRPWVILKLATTLDGKIATASGDSRWVTGPEARMRVQKLRQLADAVLIGKNTALCDRPQLTVRQPDDWPRQPLRLVASGQPADYPKIREIFGPGGCEIVSLSEPEDWGKMLDDLGSRNIMVLLIEGGGELAASALASGAVNRAEFHIAPKILGGRHSRTAVAGSDPLKMAQAMTLREVEVVRCGADIIFSGLCPAEGKEA